MSSKNSIGGIITIVLAGGYGTRLQEDLRDDAEFSHLFDLNKALLPLPLQKTTLLDAWMTDELPPRMDHLPAEKNLVLIATNQHHLPQFEKWMQPRAGDANLHLFSDGTLSNETRLGAIGTLHLALQRAFQLFPPDATPEYLVVVPSDTLLRSDYRAIDLMLSRLQQAPQDHLGVLISYPEERANFHKRGILEVDPVSSLVTKFLEKPSPSSTHSTLASPSVYVFRHPHRLHELLLDFLTLHAQQPLEERDAPGKFISWLINVQRQKLLTWHIAGRFDVGSLQDYRICSATVWSHAYPRLGLMGNPSDGCGGKAITVSISNFAAVVRLIPTFSPKIRFVPHAKHDLLEADSIHSLYRLFNGGLRLLRAAVYVFRQFCHSQDIPLHARGFELSYDTTVPRQVGLAGSSALVAAAFKCLEKWYSISLDPYLTPLLMLSAEMGELKITAVCFFFFFKFFFFFFIILFILFILFYFLN